MKIKSLAGILPLCLLLLSTGATAQLFTPVTITGFNQDVVAEAGTSSLTTTTMALDGVPSSNKVMYTQSFRFNNAFGGGGIPDNGQITDAAGTYQLAAYNGNNALLVQRNQNGDINLATPASFGNIRLLAFSTEGSSLLNITLTFTDGTTVNALTGYSLSDWFNATTNLVISGIGRCTRATPASGADGYTTNPRMYYIDIPISCANRQKLLQKINIANVTTAGANAPYPNTVVLGLSGKAYSQTITSTITHATCAALGSATLNITGSAGPYNISWNTATGQTGPTATNLTAGTYTATITDANSCVTTSQVTITLQNNLTMGQRADTALCQGASFTPNISGNANSYTWSPTVGVSNPAIANPVLSPAITTQYTVTGTLSNCTLNRVFTVSVNQGVTVNAGNDVSVFQGMGIQLNATGTPGTYLWTPATGLSNTAILNPVASPQTTTTYVLRITTPQGCTNTDTVKVTVAPYCVKPLNAFSPNGDGMNDRWLITSGNCLTSARVQVYNRYGSLVYESANYKNDWDGTYKGKPVPDGTYYYLINYVLINGQKVFAKGDVTILR